MTFVSYEFLLFMAVCLVLCRLGGRGLRPGLLFCASLAFLWLSGGVLSLAAYGFSALTVWAGAPSSHRGRTARSVSQTPWSRIWRQVSRYSRSA